MQNIKSRTAYTWHVIRAHLQGFEPMSYAQFVKFVMFNI
jgi:hypothetical protein